MGESFRWIHDAWTTKKASEKHVIITNRFDREDLERMLEEIPAFEGARDALGDFTPTGKEASTDAFFALLKGLPLRRPIEEMDPEHFINHRVDSEIQSLPEVERLRRFSVGDEVQSALAVEQIEPDMETLFDRIDKDQEKAREVRRLLDRLTQARQEKHDIDEMVERWKGEHQEDEDDDEPEADEEESLSTDDDPQDSPGDEAVEQEQAQEQPAKVEPSDDPEQAQPVASESPQEDDEEPNDGEEEQGDQGEPQLPDDLADQQSAAGAAIDDLEAEVEEAMEQLMEALDHVGQETREVMRVAIDRVADEAESLFAAATAWGMDPGELRRLPADERLELAERLNTPYFRKIAELFGPMRNLMLTEQSRKVSYGKEEVYDVEMGNELSQLLPTELLALDQNPDDFYRRYSEGRLLQYKMQGEERLARGGIIFCEDGSGSMHGEKEMWAKAVMLCLLHLARQQNRPFHLIHFGGPGTYKLISFNRPQDYTLDDILNAAELYFGGGTNFETPLGVALELLLEQHARQGSVKSDVVFCTDDECRLQEDFLDNYLKESERLQFTTYGFAIPIPGMHVDPQGALMRMTQGKTIEISDLLSGNDIREVFRSL